MEQDPLALILRTLGDLYIFILTFRFLLQLARADYYNPISQSVVRLTAVPLAPLQRLLPKIGRMDISPLVLAFVLKFGLSMALIAMHQGGIQVDIITLLVVTAASLLNSVLTLYFWAVLASVIISWVAPGSYHPAPQIIQQLTEPLFKLAQKVIPPLGGLDLSPILIFLAIQIIQAQLAPFVI